MEVNLRAVVLDILEEIESNNEFSHIIINNALLKYQYLDKSKRSFINKLSLGIIESQIELDYIINKYSKTPVKKMKPVIRRIVRMGVYQIIYMDNVPDSAACNEAVKLAVKRGFAGLKGFVNGVLRNISRNKDNIEYPDYNKSPYEYLSVKYSMPMWIIELWSGQMSIDTVKSVLEGMKCEKKTYIRCNTSKASREQIKELLQRENVTVKEVENIPYAYEISDYDYIAGLKSFQDGMYQIQDISSMLAGEYTAPKAGDTIVDVCGAPGGKSINAALKMSEQGDCGRVIARDLSDYKVALIDENIKRLNITNIQTQVYDALDCDESLINKADIVIADLPCSGLGIIGRKPDIKYNASPEKLQSLVDLQRDILKVVSRYVKSGGVLMYSTCTINRAENEDNADWICKELGFTKDGEYHQLLPANNSGIDGFFVARLIKN